MPVSTRSKGRTYQDEPLTKAPLIQYKDGYNSYAQSQSQVKNTEVPAGRNCRADDNGAMSDRNGKAAASPAFPTGYQTAALGQLKKYGVFVKLALHGDKAYAFTESTLTALTGFTFTPAPPRDCRIFQAVGRTYFVNGVDQPYYTSDGATLTLQSGAFPMKYAVPYFQRLYCVRPQYPDRVYFSNPISVDVTTAGSEPANYSVSNFGTFDVNYAVTPPTPIKNAGFLQLGFDEGVVITSLKKKGNVLRVRTQEHGIWVITAVGINDDGTTNHTIEQVVGSGSCPAPLSVFTSDNDELHYGGNDLYFYGEVALYQSPRTTAKSGRVHTEMVNVPASVQADVVGIQFKNAEYVFYGAGTYNDRCLVRDKVLDAWSTPYSGWNVSCAFVYHENDGRVRLFAGSSKTTDPYVYELETGTTDAGTAIDAYFSDKNSDADLPGIPKYEAFSQVFYSYLVDRIDYDVYLDGRLIKSSYYQVPGTAGSAAGIGTQAVGLSAVGVDGTDASYGTPTATDGYFTINHGYLQGDKLQIVYRKGSSVARYRILQRQTYLKKGKPTP